MSASNQLSAFNYAVQPSGNLRIKNIVSAYTISTSDRHFILNCTSGTFTVSLTAAATLGAGFNVTIWNTGTGVITIDPNGTETVDGVDPTTKFKIGQGTGVQLLCTGTSWLTGATRNSGAASIGVLGVQLGRNSAGDMAVATTGQGAVALGGSYASGTDSFAAAIANNTSTYGANGSNSIAMAFQSRANASDAAAFGSYTRAQASGSLALGQGQAMGSNSIAIGSNFTAGFPTANGNNSVAIGSDAVAGQNGKYVYSGSYSYDAGGVQYGLLILRNASTSATPVILTSDRTAAGTDDQVILPNNSAFAFTGTVVARRQAAGGTESAAWKVEGLIRREANAASTTLVFSLVTAISNVPLWGLALTADTTNGGLAVTATGAASTNIRWVATIQTSEVTYA